MREKRTRVLAVLVIMMMTFALMPAQTAWANYKDGGPCPRCHADSLMVVYNGEYNHYVRCQQCLFGLTDAEPRTPEIFEDHYGGEATCSAKAVCEGCGWEYGSFNFDRHVNIVEDKAVAATCTEAGKTAGKHCGDCDKVLEEQKEVKALGHDWGEWTVTKEATTTEEGVETRVCKNDSSHTETRKIAKKEVTEEEEVEEKTTKANSESKTKKATTDSQPQTGDESQSTWVIMMMLSAALLIALIRRRIYIRE